jgi:hypothetical protein
MGAAVYRFEEAESRELMTGLSTPLESGPVESPQPPASDAPAWVPVKQAYERWAPTYDQSPNPLLSLEERKLAALIPGLRGKRLLDLAWHREVDREALVPGNGCGSGS